MRSYRHYEEAVELVKTAIAERTGRAVYFLPGEIPLAAELGVSRMTLRKALSQVEQDGLIRRDRMKTEIVGRKDVLARCGKIVFVANTCHSTIIHGAVERLWMKMSQVILSHGGQLEFFGVNTETTLDEWKSHFQNGDIFFLTAACPENAPLPLNKIVFSLLEGLSAPNRIYLDNYSAGYLAGQTLLRAGCHKLLAICFDYKVFHNQIFARRMDGFAAALAEAGQRPEEAIRLIPYPSAGNLNPEIGDRYSSNARKAIEQAVEAGCDGVFVASDEEIGRITGDLFRNRLVPDRVKLLTLNGSGDALRHQPPIGCVSHATDSVVAAIMIQLRLIAENRFTGPVIEAVKPSLYAGHTLGPNLF